MARLFSHVDGALGDIIDSLVDGGNPKGQQLADLLEGVVADARTRLRIDVDDGFAADEAGTGRGRRGSELNLHSLR